MTPEVIAKFVPALLEWDAVRTEAMALAATGDKGAPAAFARLANAEGALASLARIVRRTGDREDSLSSALND